MTLCWRQPSSMEWSAGGGQTDQEGQLCPGVPPGHCAGGGGEQDGS